MELVDRVEGQARWVEEAVTRFCLLRSRPVERAQKVHTLRAYVVDVLTVFEAALSTGAWIQRANPALLRR